MQVYKLNNNELKFVNLNSLTKKTLLNLEEEGLGLQNLYTPGAAAAEAKAAGIKVPRFSDEPDNDGEQAPAA